MSKQVYCLNTIIKITVSFPYTAPFFPKSRPHISSPFHLFLPISQRSETAWPSLPVSCERHTDRVLPPSPTLPERKPIADITGPYRALRDTFPHFLTMTWLGLRWLEDVEAATVPGQMEKQLRGRLERQKKKGWKTSDTKSPQEVDVGWERLGEKKKKTWAKLLAGSNLVSVSWLNKSASLYFPGTLNNSHANTHADRETHSLPWFRQRALIGQKTHVSRSRKRYLSGVARKWGVGGSRALVAQRLCCWSPSMQSRTHARTLK